MPSMTKLAIVAIVFTPRWRWYSSCYRWVAQDGRIFCKGESGSSRALPLFPARTVLRRRRQARCIQQALHGADRDAQQLADPNYGDRAILGGGIRAVPGQAKI